MLQTGPARESIVVGVPDQVDTSHLQHPVTEPERLVFGLISPPSDTRDCAGRPLAAIAAYRADVVSPSRVVAVPENGHGPSVVYRIGADARDLLDQGVDVLVTDDPAALDYAARRDGYDVVALPWAWTYVLAGPAPVPPDGVSALGAQLAAAGVHGDVRAADSLSRWSGLQPCEDAPVNPARATSRRIAYSTNDAVARDLATRLVAVAASGQAFGGGTITALPLESRAFDAALAARNEFGYVATVPYRMSCAPFASLGATPLVDARSHVVVRHGVVGVDVDADGMPRLVVSQ